MALFPRRPDTPLIGKPIECNVRTSESFSILSRTIIKGMLIRTLTEELMDKSKILIVEDEPLAALEMQETLEAAGYSVPEVIASGDAVLPAVLRWKPNLVIMDIRLASFTDGVDAAERMRVLSDAPLIYVTAYPSRGSQDRAARTRPFAYLLKPLSPEVLRKTVSQALSGEVSVN